MRIMSKAAESEHEKAPVFGRGYTCFSVIPAKLHLLPLTFPALILVPEYLRRTTSTILMTLILGQVPRVELDGTHIDAPSLSHVIPSLSSILDGITE